MKTKSKLIWPVLVVILTLLMYKRTLCPVLFGGDSPMHAFFMQGGNGFLTPNIVFYKLASLLTILPLGSPAIEANLVSAIFGILTIVMLYFCLARVFENPVIAVSASLLVAFGNTFWKVTSFAETYTFTTFLISLIWWFTLKPECSDEKTCRWKMILPPVLLALAIIDEPLAIFILPGLIVYHLISKTPALARRIIGLVLFSILAFVFAIFIGKASANLRLWDIQPVFTLPSLAEVTTWPIGQLSVEVLIESFAEWGPIFFLVAIGGLIHLVVTKPGIGWGIIVSILSMCTGLCLTGRGTDLLIYGYEYRIALILPLFAFGFASALNGAYGRLTSHDQLLGEESFIPKDKVPHFINAFYLAFPVLLVLFNLGYADTSRQIFLDRMIDNSFHGIHAPATLIAGGKEYYAYRFKDEIEGVSISDSAEMDLRITGVGDYKDQPEPLSSEIEADFLAEVAEDEMSAGRNVYFSVAPTDEILAELSGRGIHLEHDGLLYIALRDDSENAVNDGRPIPFANAGQEADVWETYDLDHLYHLENSPPEYAIKPYLKRYYDELVNYGSFSLEIENYLLSRYMLDSALTLGDHLLLDTDPIIPELALSSYYSADEATLGLFEYAYQSGIDFPDRDTLRANLHYFAGDPQFMEIGEEIYDSGDFELLDSGLIEALLGIDIDNGDLENAREKALRIIARYDGFTEEDPVPENATLFALTFAMDQKVGDALWHLAYVSHQLGDEETADEIIRLFVDLNPGFLNDKLNMLITAGGFEIAGAFYQKIVDILPEDWRSIEGLAVALYRQGEEGRAKELAAVAIEHRPDSTNLKRILGIEIEETPEDSPEAKGGE